MTDLQAVRDAAEEIGRPPTKQEVRETTDIDPAALLADHESWVAVLRAADLNPSEMPGGLWMVALDNKRRLERAEEMLEADEVSTAEVCEMLPEDSAYIDEIRDPLARGDD